MIVAVGTAIGGLLTGFYGFNKWLITKFLSELKPNGGSSMRDQVNTNTDRLERVEQRVDDIYKILAGGNHG